MDDFNVTIACCEACNELTIIPKDKENEFYCCAHCGTKWDSGSMYIGGTATVTNIVENG